MTRETRSHLGQVDVTLAAAEQYAEGCWRRRHLRFEEARRELTELLLDARVGELRADILHVRARSRRTQLDVSATVRQEGRIVVVLSASVREYR